MPRAKPVFSAYTGSKFSNDEIVLVKTMVAHHLRPLLLAQNGMSDRAVYRFFRDTQEEGPGVLLVWMADRLATKGQRALEEELPHQRAVIESLLTAYFVTPEQVVHPPRLVTGHDLMQALQLPPGPVVGELLTAIQEAQAEGQVTTREAALQFAKHYVRAPRASS